MQTPAHPIYTDLDQVLIAPIIDPVTDLPVDLVVRPDVAWFLESISRYGELCLLSSANLDWVNFALQRLGAARKFITRVYTISDLYPIALRLEMIDKVKDESDREQLDAQVPPLLTPGVIFDDYPVGSWMYRLKAIATGIASIDPLMWIEVAPFTSTAPDVGGLRQAFQEFLKRNVSWSKAPRMSGPGPSNRKAV